VCVCVRACVCVVVSLVLLKTNLFVYQL